MNSSNTGNTEQTLEAFRLSQRLARSRPSSALLGAFLGYATGCKRAFLYAAEPPAEIDLLRREFDLTLFDPKTIDESQIDSGILDEAVAVCEVASSGDLPAPIAWLARKARVSVIASRHGSEPAATAERSLSRSLARAGLTAAHIGSIYADGGDESKAAAIIDNSAKNRELVDQAAPKSPAPFSVTAIMAVFNESDVIVSSIEKMLAQGVGVYVIDNWSTDGTYEAIAAALGPELAGLERFPAAGPTGNFDLRSLLTRKEEIAKALRADWFIHCDADEIRCSPWPGVSLRDAIYRVDQEGYNAINHTVVEFRPTDDGFRRGADFEKYFQYFSFGAQQADFVRINAWKNFGQLVSLASTGGHQIMFEGRRIYPYKFLIKHYPVRSQEHGARKVFRERRGRYLPAAKAKGWHFHYDRLQESHSFLAEPSALTRFDSERFYGDYLAQRLTGIGALRRNPVSAGKWS
jgi:hypothetical protein